MIVYRDFAQGSWEWEKARLAMPTSSQFSKILTAQRLGYSTQSQTYQAEIVAEWILGHAIETFSSGYTERGSDDEERARAGYEIENDVEVEEVGFVTTDDGLVGCSPDGLIGDEGGVEIKILKIQNHVQAMLDRDPGKYVLQVQGSLWITKRAWWDVYFWNAWLPAVTVRVLPDPKVHKALDEHLPRFVRELHDKMAALRKYAPENAKEPRPPITPEDVAGSVPGAHDGSPQEEGVRDLLGALRESIKEE